MLSCRCKNFSVKQVVKKKQTNKKIKISKHGSYRGIRTPWTLPLDPQLLLHFSS